MENINQLKVDIRTWSEADLPLLQRLMGDPIMTEHLGGPETPEQIGRRHHRYCNPDRTDSGPMFVITVGPEQLAAGSIGYWEHEWQGEKIWETGWSVLPEFQGKGIATQACKLVVELARGKQSHRQIHAFPSPENGPSNAICRKAGFTLLGVVEFEYPKGVFAPSNDWCLNLFADLPKTSAI
jgi:RimJ/RimL family protein N-acetyltransferase